MGPWTSLVVLSVMAVNTLSLPRPDEYQIPTVGNNRRSQYYVLHDDGSFKYGYDTGDDAFESQKTSSGGDVDGKFGYRDPDGQEIRVQYTSGQGGFVAQGDHIPKVHPDVAAAFAAARSAGPFVDPLAGTGGGDRAYDFNFSGDEHSRNEISDSDGTVRGSYSYVDEFGRTRSYTYRAGKGIGFVIEGDDIPQQVQPLPTHTSSTQFGASSQRVEPPRRTVSQAATRAQPTAIKSVSSSQRAESSRRVQTPAKTYFPPTQTHSGAASTSSVSSSASKFSSVGQQQSSVRSRPATHTTSTASVRTRPFEAANTRTFQSPSGSYSLAYETSSHSRQESGDDDNNVRGKFSFKADDDGVDRSVSYEAGSATGFVASGRHLPIGPIVPGAPTGQVTGKIVKVVQTPFIDPLADGNLDASFNFDFDSDTYSRSETADEDGNVSGTYSVLGEDDILRTYRYRAGKGIGFETEEISAVPAGHRRSQSIASSATRQHTTSAVSQGAAARGSTRVAAAPVTTLYTAPQQTSSSSAASHSSRLTGQGSQTFSGTRQPAPQFSSSASSVGFKSSQSGEVFPGFTLRQYDASEGRGKYGYVLKFDD